jgi:TolB-like protein/Flp pilus assembly protein TadD
MSVIGELSRRNVFRVGIAYVIVAWLTLQVVDVVFENIGAPDWVIQAIMLLLALGFPITMLFSWAYEVTPEGIKRESEIDRSQSITSVTGGKLNNAIIFLLVVALAYFVWESRVAAPPSAEPLASTSDAAPVSVAARPDSLSIAVLPFENRSDRKEDEFFVEGMHDDLLTTIAKIGALKVISRTSVMEYKDISDRKIPQIARELGVTNILEGGIQRSGNKVRINMQLIHAETDEHLWAEIYDRELTAENLFDIQSEISAAVAEALHAALTPGEQRRIDTAATHNLEAYDAYLRGKQLMATREVVALQESVDQFRLAVEMDAQFALAWVGLADALNLMTLYGNEEPSDYFSVRQDAINTALEIEPELGEAYTSLGALFDNQDQYEDAEQAYRRAIKLSPNYATSYHWLSNTIRTSWSRRNEARAMAEKAQELDPRSAIIGVNLGASYRQLGDYASAEQEAQRVLGFDPGYAGAHSNLGDLHWISGRLGDAYLDYTTALRLDPASLSNQANVGYTLFELGASDEAAEVTSSMQEVGPDSVDTHQLLVYIGISNGADVGESLQVLSQSTDRYTRLGAAFGYVTAGDEQAALDAYLSVVEQGLQDSAMWPDIIDTFPYSSCYIAWTLIKTGDENLGEEFAKATLRQLDDLLPGEIDHTDNMGADVCYLAIGDLDAALATIEMQLEHGHYADWPFLHTAPTYDLVRDNPRYIAAHEQYGREIEKQRELAGL